MKLITDNKTTLAAVLIFIMMLVLYNLFFKQDELILPDEGVASSVGEDLIKIYGDLQQVSFDQSLFASPSYANLVDFGMVIPPQALGRPNPFDIIGRD